MILIQDGYKFGYGDVEHKVEIKIMIKITGYTLHFEYFIDEGSDLIYSTFEWKQDDLGYNEFISYLVKCFVDEFIGSHSHKLDREIYDVSPHGYTISNDSINRALESYEYDDYRIQLLNVLKEIIALKSIKADTYDELLIHPIWKLRGFDVPLKDVFSITEELKITKGSRSRAIQGSHIVKSKTSQNKQITGFQLYK